MRKGFTLVEMVVYISVIVVVFVIVVNTIILAGTAWGNARVIRNVATQGGGAMERILREIRLAESVNSVASTLNTHPGVLELNTIVSPNDETPTTRTFSLSSQNIVMEEGSSSPANITSGVEITNLVFYRIDNNGTSETVRIELTVRDGAGRFEKTKNFYGAAVLRRSY